MSCTLALRDVIFRLAGRRDVVHERQLARGATASQRNGIDNHGPDRWEQVLVLLVLLNVILGTGWKRKTQGYVKSMAWVKIGKKRMACVRLRQYILSLQQPWSQRSYPFLCLGYFRPKNKDAKTFKNHLNPVIFIFIGLLSLSTLRWVPMCQSFGHFGGFLHHHVLAKLATSSIRVYANFTYRVNAM